VFKQGGVPAIAKPSKLGAVYHLANTLVPIEHFPHVGLYGRASDHKIPPGLNENTL
jgi:hypothetical protein